MTEHSERYIEADWPSPANIKAFVTTRKGGESTDCYSSFNMGLYSGDDAEKVLLNRSLLMNDWSLKQSPQWLKQVHGIQVVSAGLNPQEKEGDACWTSNSGRACVVQSADCLPVLFCDTAGTTVAAAHAGWKGLVDGVLEETIKSMGVKPDELLAWMGPAISQKHFEVGPEVREQFLKADLNAESAFKAGKGDRWYADLYSLARARLQAMGLTKIYGGEYCTVEQEKLFYSYRRDGKHSGRMASVVWINPVKENS